MGSSRIPTAVARKNFAGMVKRTSDGERIKLTRYDKTLAVLIPKKDLTRLEDCELASGAAKGKRKGGHGAKHRAHGR